MSGNESIHELKALISEKESEIDKLKAQLNELDLKDNSSNCNDSELISALSQKEILRYSRQIILPEINVAGQLALKKSSVLIVGAGGLGCPVGIYLAAAGVGRIGIVDHDTVDITNLHRQIAHRVESVGLNKSLSLRKSLLTINPLLNILVYPVLLNSSNIEEIISTYDIIVDASDNVPTRYLLNDAAVLFNKYLVSGSALKFEGQLTVYNYLDGPCYRCLFPQPPSSNNLGNCSESGVLGAITGVIGCLQALEVIKICVGIHPTYYKKMLLFDGLNGDLKSIALRGKKLDCDVCGNNPTLTKLIDYEAFCQQSATDKVIDVNILSESDRITCGEYKKILDSGSSHVLIDVRPSHEMNICCLPNSVNIPINEITQDISLQKLKEIIRDKGSSINFVVCRRGNDSQTAVVNLRKLIQDCEWKDIKGGLNAWHNEIDLAFPIYFS